MTKIIALVALLVSTAALADTIGVNYTTTHGNDPIRSEAVQLVGSHDITTDVAVVAELEQVKDKALAGHSYQLLVGTKIKLAHMGDITPFITPMLSYNDPTNNGNYFGYQVDAGVDYAITHRLTLTPVYTFADAFHSYPVRKQTLGLGVAYAVTDSYTVSAKVRQEYNEFGGNGTRYYVGVARNF
jgi:opacity protein-like surface antigen